MPAIQNSAVIALQSANDNVLAGSQFEYLPFDAYIEFGVQGSLTGLLMDIYSGTDVLCESYAVPLQNRFPIYPDDFAFSDEALAGDRLKIRIRNTTAGSITAFWNVRLSPV